MRGLSAPHETPPTRLHVIIAGLLLCAISVFILDLPSHPDALTAARFLTIPLEVPALVVLLLLAPRRVGWLLRLVLVLILGVILFLKAADLGTQTAFQRPFNPYLDAKMMADGWNLLSGSVGTGTAAAILIGVVLVFLLMLMLLYRTMTVITATRGRPRRQALLVTASLLVLGCLLIPLQRSGVLPQPVRVEAGAAAYLIDRSALIATSIADMRRFESQIAAVDTVAPAPQFSKLRGKDVVLIFVESYGRSAIEDARYAPTIRPRLASMEGALTQQGFHTASAWVTSPTVAGLSWLAHGTFLSGLWVDNQARYDRMIRSARPSLNRLFSQAGWESVAVMPAITLDWPEADYFGYDRVLAAKDLGYQGKPFNWITMPDQYTLSAFQRMVRDRPRDRPVMAEIALISSHAPWTPVASLIDWDAVGDGTIFTPQAEAGDTPAVVWADPERVRSHYIRTIDYSLQTIASFITRYGRDTLFMVIGDHQPANLVTGPNASRAVPMHVISRDADLIEPLLARGFEPRLIPGASPERPMNLLRQLLVDVYDGQ